MKGLKKLLTGVLAASMIMSMSITAFAGDNTESLTPATEQTTETEQTSQTQQASSVNQLSNTTSITVTHEVPVGAEDRLITYDYYQILKADILSLEANGVDQSGQAAYYVDTQAMATALSNTGIFTVTQSATETRWNVTTTVNDATRIRDALNTDAVKSAALSTGKFYNTADGTATGTLTTTATKSGLTPGYYLVLSDLGTVAALQTLGEVTINEKNEFPGVTKTKSTLDVYAMFGIGSELTYTLDVTIPASVAEKDITVYDTATNGLTLDSTIEAKVGDAKIDGLDLGWTVSSTVAATETTKAATVYTTVIPAATVIAHKGETITLTYKATINENAVVYELESNTAHIEYENYKSAETTPVNVKTIAFKVFKYEVTGTDAEGKEIRNPLTGAKFSLWTAATGGNRIQVVKVSDGHYRVAKDTEKKTDEKDMVAIEVDSNGYAQVDGLELATYYLQEDEAPLGFNKLTARKQFVIEEANVVNLDSIKVVDVENKSGSVLPSTGGIGTTIFYVLGGILIVAGIAYFILRRKADTQ